MQKAILFTIGLIFCSNFSSAQDSWTHFIWNGKVESSTTGGILFKYSAPSSMPPLRLTASPSGKVLYFEDLDYGKDPETQRRQIVHICRKDGKELQSFVLKQRPNEFYNYARFCGESIIVLSEIGRKYGKARETVLMTDSGKTFSWLKASGDLYSAAFFPEKKKVLSIVLACPGSAGNGEPFVIIKRMRTVVPWDLRCVF